MIYQLVIYSPQNIFSACYDICPFKPTVENTGEEAGLSHGRELPLRTPLTVNTERR